MRSPGGRAGAASDAASLDSIRVHEEIAARAARLRNGQPVTLRLLLPSGCESNVEPVIRAFESSSGVKVEFSRARLDDINTKLLLDTLAGENDEIDLALPATFGLPDLVEAGCIAPLDALAALHEPPEVRDGCLYSTGDFYRGKRYGYQADGDTYLMFYNRRLLEDDKVHTAFETRFGEPLTTPKTWTDLDRALAFFSTGDASHQATPSTLFRTPSYAAWEWWSRLHAKGRLPLADDLTPQIDSPEGVAALEELLATTQHLYPTSRTASLVDNWNAFATGEYFCNIGWGGTQKHLRGATSKVRDALVYGPLPGGRFGDDVVTMPYFNWGWNYVLSSTSAHPEIAYLFMLFASCPTPSTWSVREPLGYFDPFRKEHYHDATVRETYGEAFLVEHEKSMQRSIPDLYLNGQSRYFEALSRFLARAIDGRVSARDALAGAANAWRRIHDRMGHEQQMEAWQGIRSRYPEDIRRHLQ